MDFRHWICVGMAVLWAAAAQAQTYRCSSGGSVYLSDKPCGTGQVTGRVGSFGPTAAPPSPSYAPSYSRPSGVEAHVKYLGAECASISEGMRTAGVRGVRGTVVSELQREYQRKCALEDQDARRKVQQEAAQDMHQKQAQREAVVSARAQTQQSAERCAGMRDVITLKRHRESTLNDKEVAALRALEVTFNGQCLAR
jgi:hypothetical protein